MVLNLKNYASNKKKTVKCEWTERHKRIFFQDWNKTPLLTPKLFIFNTEIQGKILKIISRGSINKKDQLCIYLNVKSSAILQLTNKGKKSKLKNRGRDYDLTIQYEQIKNSVSLKIEKDSC